MRKVMGGGEKRERGKEEGERGKREKRTEHL